MVHTDPCFVHKLGPKIEIIRGFTQFLFRIGFQLKLLIAIESPSIFHGKSVKKKKKERKKKEKQSECDL